MKHDSPGSKIDEETRPMVARWLITGNMVLKTAAHPGGQREGSVDMMVLRDPKEGGGTPSRNLTGRRFA